jgi:hypothetical protein
MDGTKTTTNWIIAGLVALVVIIGGGWLVARERSGNVTGTTATSTDTTLDDAASSSDTSTNTAGTNTSAVPESKNPVTSASGETITVIDQPAGANVIVADVKLTKPSWVVIRDTKGWALGAAWFNESRVSATVSLLRNTIAGQTYEAVIYVDDGDKKFTLHGGDMLVASSQGAPVSSTFTAK